MSSRQIVKGVQRPPAEPSSLIRSLTSNVAPRQGEGFPVKLSHVEHRSGHARLFGLDISTAPAPQRHYAAEIAAVQSQDGEARLVFAQRSLGADGLESALVVRMNPHAASQMLESLDTMASPGVAKIADLMSIRPLALTDISQRPNSTARVVANFAAVAISGYDTCIDFYQASPWSMKHAPLTNELALDAVVRVDIQTALFLSVMEGLRAVVSTLPVADPDGDKQE